MPFVMVTARADKDSVILAKEENITAYISKPITFDGLKTKINVIINSKKQNEVTRNSKKLYSF